MSDLSKLMFEIGIKSLKDTIAAREKELDEFLRKYNGKTITLNVGDIKSQLDSISAAMSGVGKGKDSEGIHAYQEELSKLNDRFDKLISTIEKLNTKSGGSGKSRRKKQLDEEAEAAKRAEAALGGLAAVSKQVGFNVGSQGDGFEKASFSVKAYLDNIQKLIREEQVVGNYIKKAQEAIKFGEGHNRDTNQMKAYLQSLYSVQSAIRGLLANREQFKDFLGTYKALERPLPGSNNDIALMGAHLKNLKENVTMADAALRSMAVSLRLNDDGAPNLRRNIEQIEVAITALNKEKEKLQKAGGRADEFGFSKESIERKRREIEAYIKTLEELKKNETLLKNTRLSALWTPENPGEKAPLGRYFLSLLGAGNEETQRVNELVQNKERIKKAFTELQEAIQKLEAVRAKGLGLGLDISGSSSQVMAARDLLAQLSGAAYNEKMLSNSNGVESLITQYQALLEVLVRLRNVQGESNKKAIEKNKSDEKSAQDQSKAIERAIEQYDKLSVKLERAKRLQKEAADQGIATPRLDAIIQEMQHYLSLLDQLRTRSKLNDTPGTTVNMLMQEGAYRSLTTRLSENTAEVQNNITAKNRLTMEERNMAAALQQTSTHLKGQSQILSDLKSLATQYIGVWGAQGFLQKIIQTGGQLESQRKSLTAILGQASYANDLYAKIQKLAVQSPFGVVQLDQYSKNLSAFGFQYNELFDMTKRLADIAAGTGTDFGRLALAIGHVRSEMALTGYTLRQFAMANVPMLKMLAENLGVTTQEIRKMVREKKVSYEDVVKVIKDLTDEGGMFYNMQETMSEAVSAKFKNLKDSMDIMYGQMAESLIGDVLKGIAKGLTEVTKRWQSFGTVIFTTAALLGTYKLYMLAVNRGIQSQTTSLLTNRVATQTLTAEQVKHLAVTNQITRADLANAVATGKLSFEQAKLAAEYFALDKVMLKNVASMKQYQMAMRGVSSSGFVAALTNPWTAALIASEAVLGSYMAYNQWSDSIYQDVETYIERAKTANEEIGKYLDSASKPTEEKDLSAEIEQMKTILKNSELYTEELEKQVELAPNLSSEYDVLIAKMKEVNSQLAQSGVNAAAVAEIIKASSAEFGGWDWAKLLTFGAWDVAEGDNAWDRFFEWATNDDINSNVEDMQKSADALKRVIAGMGEYRSAMEGAVQTMIEMYGYTELANLPFDEQIQLIAENKTAWSDFTYIVGQSSTEFYKHANLLRDAAREVSDDWMEIAEDDVPKMMAKMQKEFGFENRTAEFRQWAQENEGIFSGMLDIMLAKAKERSPQIAQKIRDAVLGWINGVAPEKEEETAEHRAERHLQDIIARRNAIRKKSGREGENAKSTLNIFAKSKGLGDNYFSDTFVAEYFKSGQGYSSGFEAIQKAYKKTYDAIEAAKKVNDQRTIANLTKTFNQLDMAMDAFGLDKKRSGLFPKQNKNEQDEVAKAIRERVRIVKEAADSYQYWRKAVGDENAFAHVRDEFGEILGEENLNSDNVGKLRENLLGLRAELEKRPKSKPVLEGLKEIDKELAQLDRKDFEKTSEEFASKVKLEIDNLTHAWDIFNNVRQETGDIELAVQLSGADYKTGQTQNLADALREKIQKDLTGISVGLAIGFDVNLSDEEIKREVEDEFERSKPIQEKGESDDAYMSRLSEYQSHIKGIVEATKKWRDLQKEVVKNDTSVFLKAWDNEYDRKQELDKIIAQYEESKESLDRLLKQWLSGMVDDNGKRLGITQEQYDIAFKNLTNQKNWDKFKSENDFKWVFDNISTTSLETIRKMVKSMREYAKTTEMSEKETRAWQEAMDKLTDQENVLDPLKSIVDTVKDYNDAVAKRKDAEEALRVSKMSYAERKRNGIDESTVKPLEQAQKDYRQALSDEERALLRVTKALRTFSDKIGELGSALSNLGSSVGGDFGNIMSGVGGMLGDLSNGMNSATKLGEAMKTKGFSGAIGKVTAVLGIIDSVVAFNQKLDSILPSSESLYQKYADRQRKINELQEQIADYQIAALQRQIESTNWLYNKGLSELRNQGYVKENLLKEYANSMLRPQEIYQDARSGWSKWGPAIIGAIIAVVVTVVTWGLGSVGGAALGSAVAGALGAAGTAAVGAALAAGAGAAIGTALRSAADQFIYKDGQTSARQNMRVQTRHKTFFRSEKTQNLEEWVRENYGKELFDKNHYDLIDIELAKQLLEDGPTLVGETEETLKRLVEYAEKIRELEDNVKDYVSQMFSPLVDNMTDALWDWLDTGKDMLDSFEDYASDTFQNIAKDAVKSFLKINIIDKYQDKLNDIFTAYSLGVPGYDELGLGLAVASVAGEIRDSYEALIPALQTLGETLADAFDIQGYDIVSGGDSGGSAAANTLRGVTEQTADLIASYVNSIRADLSVNRSMIASYFPQYLEAMTQNLQQIRQIEANTAAIMKSNQTIAEKITSLEDMVNGLKKKAWKLPVG